ncbi:MAG: amino acid ABC transporter ATP-binding protein [Lactobacillus sp.]|nr:amino acid ABC transporter ATP-binding protein [Lactobacillus sp.]MCH3906206.1 amino acid ABC transporter ATP-binding protein [Lactobacillus sp.]MCH3990215.1 amino acid ABC transporter ATP-binding protein [Lactobacillus sp.]MCH4069071.1 amino acid ABC transporter ATP-binding protein [Lactobacillus sp.]MCI1303942.1 amino acid ABC transporter ATP-binding protein [Lactobacillus sp.]
MLEVKNLSKSYGDQQVLHDINFSLNKGEVMTMLGPSGIGKSTLLRCLNGLEDFQTGELVFEGQTIKPSAANWQQLRQKIGMVFQSYDLFPNMTVLQNITLAPIKVQKRSKQEAEAEARKLLKRVQLADYADAYPRELSGGQKQRIAIARALAMHPDLMLFDEVTASLDPEMVRSVLDLIKELSEQDHMTMIIVTHEMNFARQIADQVLFLDEGTILEQTAGKDFFTNPQTQRAKDFLASMDF